MNRINRLLAMWLTVLATAWAVGFDSPLNASMRQVAPQAQRSQGPPRQEEFVDRFNRMFASRPPKLGSQVLDGLKAFDDQGKTFDFAALKGKHTVIVFGCLT